MDKNVQDAKLVQELAKLKNRKSLGGLREAILRDIEDVQSGFQDIEKQKKEFYELVPSLSEKEINRLWKEIAKSEKELTQLQSELQKYLSSIDKVETIVNSFLETHGKEWGPYTRRQIKEALQNVFFLPENIETIVNENSEHLAKRGGIVGEYGRYFQSVILSGDEKGNVKAIPISQSKKDIEFDRLKREFDSFKQNISEGKYSKPELQEVIELTKIIRTLNRQMNEFQEAVKQSRRDISDFSRTVRRMIDSDEEGITRRRPKKRAPEPSPSLSEEQIQREKMDALALDLLLAGYDFEGGRKYPFVTKERWPYAPDSLKNENRKINEMLFGAIPIKSAEESTGKESEVEKEKRKGQQRETSQGRDHDKEFRLFSHLISQINVELRELNKTIRETISEFHNFQKTLRAGSSTRKRKKKEETQFVEEEFIALPPPVKLLPPPEFLALPPPEFLALPPPEDIKRLPPPKENLPVPYVEYLPAQYQEVEDGTQAKKTRRQKGKSASEFNKEVVTLLKQILDAIKKQTEVNLRILNKIDSGGGRRSASEGGGGRSGGRGGGGGKFPPPAEWGGEGEWGKRNLPSMATTAAMGEGIPLELGAAEFAFWKMASGLVRFTEYVPMIYEAMKLVYRIGTTRPQHLYEPALAASGLFYATGIGETYQGFISTFEKSITSPNAPGYGFNIARDMGDYRRLMFYGSNSPQDIYNLTQWIAGVKSRPDWLFSMTPEASTEFLGSLLSAGKANIGEDDVRRVLHDTRDILIDIREMGYDQARNLSSIYNIMEDSYRRGAYSSPAEFALTMEGKALTFGGAGASTGQLAQSLAEAYSKATEGIGHSFNNTMAFITNPDFWSVEGLQKVFGKNFDAFKNDPYGAAILEEVQNNPHPSAIAAIFMAQQMSQFFQHHPEMQVNLLEALMNGPWGQFLQGIGRGLLGTDMGGVMAFGGAMGMGFQESLMTQLPSIQFPLLGNKVDAADRKYNQKAFEALKERGMTDEELKAAQLAIEKGGVDVTYADLLGVGGAEFNKYDLRSAHTGRGPKFLEYMAKGPFSIVPGTQAQVHDEARARYLKLGIDIDKLAPPIRHELEAIEYMNQIIHAHPEAAHNVALLEWYYNHGIGARPPQNFNELIRDKAPQMALQAMKPLADDMFSSASNIPSPPGSGAPAMSDLMLPLTAGNVSEMRDAVTQIISVKTKLTTALEGLITALIHVSGILEDWGDQNNTSMGPLPPSASGPLTP
jgi:septal ring factor EnvC (AmiA/AmiB activator)